MLSKENDLMLVNGTGISTYVLNTTTQLYELTTFQAFDFLPNFSFIGASNDGRTLLMRLESGFSIFVSFGSNFIRLPSFEFLNDSLIKLPNDEDLKTVQSSQATGKISNDGSMVAIVDSDGYIHEYYRTLNGSDLTVPLAVNNCEWAYTAYVCNCSNDPNSLSLETNTTCSCIYGFVWSNYSCIPDCSIKNNPLCDCATGFEWNFLTKRCEKICTGDIYSTGSVSSED